MYCYRCGHLNPNTVYQCQNCGGNLREYIQGAQSEDLIHLQEQLNAAQELIQRLKHYIPPIITEYLLHDQARLYGERREVAILFADAVNFTRLSASLDAEAVFDLINHLLGRLVACVHRYGGLVDKFTGEDRKSVV